MTTVLGTDVREAALLLTAGELVAVPTETVYGLAANAFDPDAVLKVFEVKQRPSFDPLIVHIGRMEQLREVVSEVPKQALALIDRFWPGPLTLVLRKSERVPDVVTSGLDTVAVRMPSHPLALELLRSLDFPLAAPSANPFGYVSPTTAQHVMDQLGGSVPYILDGGPCTVGVESTIVGWDPSAAFSTPRSLRALRPKPSALLEVTLRGVTSPWVLYRPGGLPLEVIEEMLGPMAPSPERAMPVAPGMLASHYAPRKPVIVGDVPALLRAHTGRRIGVISFRRDHGAAINEVLSPQSDLHEAARNLFSALRLLDASDVDLILAEEFPEEGLGRAINDRLRRASAR